LAVPPHGWVNLHFSLLPAFRGAGPVAAAVRAGLPETGVTTFRLERGMDTGPVFRTARCALQPRDTTGSLTERLAELGAPLLVATLDDLAAGRATPVPQPADGVSIAGKSTPADAEVDWSADAGTVDRHVRAATPEPGAWTASPWGRLVLGPVEPVPTATAPLPGDPALPDPCSPVPPGGLVVGKRTVLVGTGDGVVRLGTVTPPGKRALPAADWARGARPAAGARLGVAA
jgi:methionyl-tRNA formyltransferase